MTISNLDGLIDALANNAQTLIVNRASIANQLAGGFSSLWRGTGTPAQGAIPGAAAVCTKALTGAMSFNNPTDPVKSYIARGFLVSGNSATDVQLHDRLAHMGGLSGTSTGSQTVSVDVSGSSNNLANRRGASDYSDVQWWVEIYTDIGTTAVTLTVTYTNAAGTSGRTTTLSIGGASPANQDSRMFQIIGNGGEFIQSIQSVQQSATTGTAGSYGITATRSLCGMSLGLANAGSVYDWALLGLPRIHDDACLFPIMICGTTSTGTLYGNFKLIQG
jgi:hypothetical protein